MNTRAKRRATYRTTQDAIRNSRRRSSLGVLAEDEAIKHHDAEQEIGRPFRRRDDHSLSHAKSLYGAIESEATRELKWSQYWWRARESWPWLVAYVDCTAFEAILACPIIINAVTIGLAADCGNRCSQEQLQQYAMLSPRIMYEGKEASRIYQCVYPPKCPDFVYDLCHWLDMLFCTIFIIEWFLRIGVFGPKYLKSVVAIVDSLLVWGTGAALVFILEPVGVDVRYIRTFQVFRTCRLIRIARVIRLMPRFKEMWLLVRGLADCFMTLFWSGILILFVLYFFGILSLEMIGRARTDGGRSLWWDDTQEVHLLARTSFDSLESSMFTLVQFMTLDNWSKVVRSINEVYSGSILFFIGFIMITTFVLLNLVTAVVVNNAMEISVHDEEQSAMLQDIEDQAQIAALGVSFKDLDSDGSNTLSREEFMQAFRIPELANKFAVLNITERDLADLYNLLDTQDGSGEIELHEFTYGLNRLKGAAKSKDMHTSIRHVQRIQNIVTLLLSASDKHGSFRPLESESNAAPTSKTIQTQEAPPVAPAFDAAAFTRKVEKMANKQAQNLSAVFEEAIKQLQPQQMSRMFQSPALPPTVPSAPGSVVPRSVPSGPSAAHIRDIDTCIQTLSNIEEWSRAATVRMDSINEALRREPELTCVRNELAEQHDLGRGRHEVHREHRGDL
eukprot:GEMP01020550.1.p1 GENE.GEMP01020550.1~~GEMP01020550.1.p1  ORF type:complete len:674 (+),score=91.25 GEMP01020550.1:148-2169(+)